MHKLYLLFFSALITLSFVSCGNEQETDKDVMNSDNDTVELWTDPDTQYVWSSRSASMSWDDANKYCNNLVEESISNWFLPDISELRTLVQNCADSETDGLCNVTSSCTNPGCRNAECRGCGLTTEYSYSKINDNIWMWSSSVIEIGEENSAWKISFATGNIAPVMKTDIYEIRCISLPSARKRTKDCIGPDNIKWNTVDEITQTWDGSEWSPSTTGVHNETESDKECRFVCENATYDSETGLCTCDSGFKQGDGKCLTIPNPCDDNLCNDFDCLPEKINEEDKYTGAFTCRDNRTQNIWSQESSDYMIWNDAKEYCNNLVSAGYNDWQLPTIEALRMLIKNCPQTETDGDCPATYDYSPPEICEGCEKMEDGRYSMLGDALKIWAEPNSFGAWYIDFMEAGIQRIGWESGSISTWHRHIRCVHYQIGNERNIKCEGPDNIKWNTAEEITQTWSGTEWEPDDEGVYNETPSETECHYICENATYNFETEECECDPGYIQGDGKCVAISNPCTVNRCNDLECNPEETAPGSKKYTGSYTCADSETGYVWSKLYKYIGCEDLVENGFDDWRLPTISELRTLIKNCSATETGGTCPITDEDPLSGDISCGGCEWADDGRYSKLGDDEYLWSSINYGPTLLVKFSKASIYDVTEGFSADKRCIRTDSD